MLLDMGFEVVAPDSIGYGGSVSAFRARLGDRCL